MAAAFPQSVLPRPSLGILGRRVSWGGRSPQMGLPTRAPCALMQRKRSHGHGRLGLAVTQHWHRLCPAPVVLAGGGPGPGNPAVRFPTQAPIRSGLGNGAQGPDRRPRSLAAPSTAEAVLQCPAPSRVEQSADLPPAQPASAALACSQRPQPGVGAGPSHLARQ